MTSWHEGFAEQYDEWSARMTADIPFYVELAREAAGPLVELAIGNGRVAIPVALATGQRVIGVDSSPAMLAQARVNATAAGVDLDLREGDMRAFSVDEPAALDLLPVPRPPAPGDVGRPPTGVRAGCRLTQARWTVRVERVRVRPSLRRRRRRPTAGRRHSPTPCATRSATTASTSSTTTAARAGCGGRRRTSGSASSTSPGSRSRPSTEASSASPTPKRAARYVFVTRRP